MVWAGIHYGGKTGLVVPDGKVNTIVYRDILENIAFQMQEECIGTTFDYKMTMLDNIGQLQVLFEIISCILMKGVTGCSRFHGLIAPVI
jgi:hypothetical protein